MMRNLQRAGNQDTTSILESMYAKSGDRTHWRARATMHSRR